MGLTIQKENARLTVTGRSWDDVTTDSGDGLTIDQSILEEIEDILDIELPDIDDDTHIIIGLDEDGDPTLWIEGLDEPIDLGDLDLDLLDLDWEIGSYITVDDISITVDADLDLIVENIPTAIEIITPPKQTRFIDGKRINIAGMVVKAVKSDGSTWTSAKYPNGHIPLGELILEPKVAGYITLEDITLRTDRCSSTVSNRHFTATASGGAVIFINENDERWMRVTFLSDHSGACGTFNGATAQANTLVYSSGGRKLYKSSQYNYSHNCTQHLVPYYPDYTPLDQEEMQELLGGVLVTWLRPQDKEPLRTSFQITVIPRGSGGGR